MGTSRVWHGMVVGLAGLAVLGSAPRRMRASRASHPEAKERARVVLSQPLPTLDGSHVKAVLVEVNYGPGDFSMPHSHPCPVIGYVLEGVLRTQVKGEAEAVYKAGDSFYEAPHGVHLVSANDSKRQPTKFLAFFVCDQDVPLSTAVPDAAKAGEK
jgi:quercetin dioxygenase-like cupin family protein